MSRKLSLTEHQKQWAYEKWCAGYTYVEIGRALKCNPSTISRHIGGVNKEKPKLLYSEPIPLTLDELMGCNKPVWVKVDKLPSGGYWCLCSEGLIIAPSGNCYIANEIPDWEFYDQEIKQPFKED